jgi:hypothetical protein
MRTALPLVAFILANLGACSFGCGEGTQHATPPAGSYAPLTITVRANDQSETVSGARVTQEFFERAQARPLLGRSFALPDYQPGATAVVVLSRDYWKERFNGDPGTIGRQIQIDGRPTVIIGVAAAGFDFPQQARLWLPEVKQ